MRSLAVLLLLARAAWAEDHGQLFDAPTAWIAPTGASGGIDHHGEPFFAATGNIGRLGELRFTILESSFKTGVTVGPMRVAVGFEKRWDESGATLYGVAGARLGPVRLHLGADPDPFGGLEWTPSIYPRTTLVLDARRRDDVYAGDIGVRYRVASRIVIELGVRADEEQRLERPSIFVRAHVNAP